MAVILQESVCQSGSCNTLSFSETTGAYSETNLNGWGAPNELTSDATAAILSVEVGDGTIYTINLFATGDFPNTNADFVYNITNEDIGYVTDEAIPDQIIKFTYTVTTESTTYIQVLYKAFYCQVGCCVNTMFVDLDFECDCATDEINKALKAFAMFQGLKQAAGCGNVTNFNNILTQLNKLCANTSCTSCN